MYSRIMVPVDLAHINRLSRTLQIAAMLGKPGGATLVYTGVGLDLPGALPHDTKDLADKLQAFADAQRKVHGLPAEAHAVTSHDPTADLGDKLIDAARQTGADLVVMASHVPGLADHWFHANAGHVAQYAPVSVFVVR